MSQKTPDDFLWWRDGVIYQIYPRSFADANGDGVGDLRGIIEHLDYLNDGSATLTTGGSAMLTNRDIPSFLGIDAIWLSPIYPSPMVDFGYDVSDYCNVDPVFGTLDDLDELVAEAHRRNIRIIMDMVTNHTSDQHPWFLESRASRDNPRRDWYIWRDPAADGGPPNNWQSVFGGRAWTWDETSGQYYLHSFLKEQPDLNWRNPQVKAAIFDILRFWLDRGVDGFRLDVFNLYFKDDQFRSNPSRPGLRAYDRQWHVYDKDRPEMHDLLREMRQLLDSYSERVSLGETFSDHLAEMAAAYYGQHNDELPLAFNFDFTRSAWNARSFQQKIERWEALLPPGAWPNYVLSNHDLVRHYTRYGAGPQSQARAKVAAAMLLTLRGTPVLYYGEEIGMRNGRIPRSRILDPVGRRYWPFHKGRDGCRTPMQWDSSPNAGFSPAEAAQPWLPINPDYREVNVAGQRDDPGSIFSFYRRLIRLRKTEIALRRGSYRSILEQPTDVLAFLRETPEQTVLVFLNFSHRPVHLTSDVPLPAIHWRVLLSTGGWGNQVTLEGSVTLSPYEVSILEATM
jgi:alpha-glucosidase